MRLTRGEKRAFWCVVPVFIGFLPPVTSWAASVEWRPFGLPFLLFWSGLMVLMTSGLMTLAFAIKSRNDGS